jgi:hypothetical protein
MGYCLPTPAELKNFATTLYDQMDKQMGGVGKYVIDIKNSWKLILVMGLASFFITILYMALLKWITKPLLYLSLALIFASGVLVIFWCYKFAAQVP